MIQIKQLVKQKMPESLLAFYRAMRICSMPFKEYDNHQYWRERSKLSGQSSVLWTNEEYNFLHRREQKKILENHCFLIVF